MEQIRDKLCRVYDEISRVTVSGLDAERIAAARILIREVYAETERARERENTQKKPEGEHENAAAEDQV